jgi:hypothetical protein
VRNAAVSLFNGLGNEETEGFVVDRKRPPARSWQKPKDRGSDWCKMGRCDYDVAVVACLCYLATVRETHWVTSDGSGHNFLDGLGLAQKALPCYANLLDIPRGALEADRWCAPHLHHLTERYSFDFCIDGKAYIRDLRKGTHYCFPTHREAAAWALRHKGVVDVIGFIDPQRRAALKMQQEDLFRVKIAQAKAEGRAQSPPAFVRTSDFPKDWSGAPTLSDILALAN